MQCLIFWVSDDNVGGARNTNSPLIPINHKRKQFIFRCFLPFGTLSCSETSFCYIFTKVRICTKWKILELDAYLATFKLYRAIDCQFVAIQQDLSVQCLLCSLYDFHLCANIFSGSE